MALVFFSYAHADEAFRNRLEVALAMLKRQGLIETWHDRRIMPGEDFANAIDANLEQADIILLLVSPDFLDSDYCYEGEMRRALERHNAGSAAVVPIIVRPCPWHDAPFGRLQALPTDGKPIAKYSDIDDAYLEIADGLRRLIERRAQPTDASTPDARPRPHGGIDDVRRRVVRMLRLRRFKVSLIVLVAVIVIASSWFVYILSARENQSQERRAYAEAPSGRLVTYATDAAFDADVKRHAQRRTGKARDYFMAGQRDFAAGRWSQAISNYQQSIDAAPTVPAYLNIGASYEFISDFSQAIRALGLGLRLADEDNDDEYRAALHDGLAHVYEDQGLDGPALDHTKSSLRFSEGEDLSTADAQITLARIQDDSGNFSDSLKSARVALQIFEKLQDQKGTAVAHNTIGSAYLDRGDFSEALREYQTAFASYSEADDILGQAIALDNIGNAYGGQGQNDDAKGAFQKALTLFRRANNPQGEGRALNNIADVQRVQGDLRLAVTNATRALKIFGKIGDTEGRAAALMNVANARFLEGDYPRAREGFESAVVFYRQAGLLLGEARATGNIAEVLRQQHYYRESLDYASRALRLFMRMGNADGEVNTYLGRGSTYLLQKNPRKALNEFRSALKIAEKSGNRGGQAQAIAGLAGAYLDLDRLAESLAASQRAIAMFRTMGNAIDEAQALTNSGLAHEKQGRHAEALRELTNARSIYKNTGAHDSSLMVIEEAIKRLRRAPANVTRSTRKLP